MADSPNPELVTATTLDTIFAFRRPVRQEQEVLIEVRSGTMKFAVGQNSNDSAANYAAGDKVIMTIGPKTVDKLHYSALSLTATFSISF